MVRWLVSGWMFLLFNVCWMCLISLLEVVLLFLLFSIEMMIFVGVGEIVCVFVMWLFVVCVCSLYVVCGFVMERCLNVFCVCVCKLVFDFMMGVIGGNVFGLFGMVISCFVFSLVVRCLRFVLIVKLSMVECVELFMCVCCWMLMYVSSLSSLIMGLDFMVVDYLGYSFLKVVRSCW